MTEKDSIKDLIDQAKNTRKLVYDVASAYLGVPPEKVVIAERDKHGENDSQNCTKLQQNTTGMPPSGILFLLQLNHKEEHRGGMSAGP